MPFAVVEFRAQDTNGNFLTDVDVEVREEVGGLPLVQLYSDRDGASPIGNPATFSDGLVRFYLAAGSFQIEVSKDSAVVDTFRNWAVGLLAESDGEEILDLENRGEFVDDSLATGSAVSLTTATGKDVITISLDAGDWDVSGTVIYKGSDGTEVFNVFAGVSDTVDTLDTSDHTRLNGIFYAGALVLNGGGTPPVSVGPARFNLAVTTTVHLVAQSAFASGTASAFGTIRARLVR